MIRVFRLGRRECHYLENNLEICLTADHKLTYPHRRGALYFVKLDKAGANWVYCKIDPNCRDFFRDRYVLEKWASCRVMRDFPGVQSFNR